MNPAEEDDERNEKAAPEDDSRSRDTGATNENSGHGDKVIQAGEITGAISFGDPQYIECVVRVASYVGTAALAGVIGNRADASAIATARSIFRSVISRWRARRGAATGEELTAGEASEIARAAALTLDWSTEELPLSVESCERNGDLWEVYLLHRPTDRKPEHLRVTVGSGDPAQARILILVL